MSADVPKTIFQVHSNAYRNSTQLPPGAVLVVGSGASGCQIADDLQQDGRQVYLSVGRHSRMPRRYRGQGLCLLGSGAQKARTDRRYGAGAPSGKDQKFYLRAPMAVTMSIYDAMAARGIVLLGHLQGINDGNLTLADDLAQQPRQRRRVAGKFQTSRGRIRNEERLGCSRLSRSQKQIKHQGCMPQSGFATLTLKMRGVGAIVWASGFRCDFDWVKLPIFDDGGEPVASPRCDSIPRYLFSWIALALQAEVSFSASGVRPAEDAAYLAEQIMARS